MRELRGGIKKNRNEEEITLKKKKRGDDESKMSELKGGKSGNKK